MEPSGDDPSSSPAAVVEVDLADVLRLLQHFLLEQRYVGALRALEQESGQVLHEGNEVRSPDAAPL